jgi:hypothetical protein
LDQIYFALIIAVSCFVQAVAGFGLPMVATPFLAALFGIRTAVPLMAVVILELQVIMIIRYRRSLDSRSVLRISASALLGIPVGVVFLSRVPESITLTILGLILIFYALYSFLNLPVPALKNPNWAFLFGFFSGLGGGAYNMAAPPMILYGDTQRWEPGLFKGNLQGCFLIITIAAIVSHFLNGSLGEDVLLKSALAIPFVLLGAFAGFHLDRFINPGIFRKIVLALLLALGINLALAWKG